MPHVCSVYIYATQEKTALCMYASACPMHAICMHMLVCLEQQGKAGSLQASSCVPDGCSFCMCSCVSR